MAYLGTVVEYHDDEGWGVIDGPDVPGGCWVHFSAVAAPGFRRLTPSQRVRFDAVPGHQDGFAFIATRVWTSDLEPDPVDVAGTDAYGSTLELAFDEPTVAGGRGRPPVAPRSTERVRSPTQPVLTPADLADLVRTGLGPSVVVTAADELSGGGFAAVWQVTLADGDRVVVKVGPPPGVALLGYERGLVAAEADYFRLVRARVPGVPVPDVRYAGDGWLITSLLPGRDLVRLAADGADLDPVRAELGAAVARLHTVTGPRFGYTGDRPAGATWPDAFTAMLADLAGDARTWGVAVPDVAPVVARHTRALAEVTRPALLHVDLWDGNVLAAAAPDAAMRLTGLVDGERFCFGDPLLDLVSPALFRRIEDEPDHPFLAGYRAADGGPALDEAALVRLALYRMHLYLVMLIEEPSRGLPTSGGRHDLVAGLLHDELARL